ncbi:MAG TPA: rhodanese-like domain-containing protein [Gemmatimonadales bacterium]|nr:rhodanese-like domain-containing protein [Gemmatimonadales bacterium]
MIFQRLYDEALAQASYLIGCAATGEAIVVDPNRDLDQYFSSAERAGLRITAVTETHIHADFLSGARELARRAGAQLLLSDCGDAGWKYGFAAGDKARLLRDGETFKVGNIAFRAVHTPGHTPEHLSFIVTDTAASDDPMGILSGDFVFCGDVGRPDLLEKAAKVAGSADSAARTLWRSLERFRALPDHLQLWPGHGAGSACGKGMSAVPQSTVGYEKRVNWAFQAPDEATFVRNVLAGQVEPPRYFATMKRLNRDGPPPLPQGALPPRLPDAELAASDARVRVDLRPTADFAAGHVPGSINIPWNRSFTGRAGTFLPYDRDLALILPGPDGAELTAVRTALGSIGLDRVAGWWPAASLDRWSAAGGRPHGVAQASVSALPAGALIVDVRSGAEWEAGHIRGARHIPVEELADRLDELPRDRPLVLQCQTGGRSAVAASVLLARGVPNVLNLAGGITAWAASGLPVER